MINQNLSQSFCLIKRMSWLCKSWIYLSKNKIKDMEKNRSANFRFFLKFGRSIPPIPAYIPGNIPKEAVINPCKDIIEVLYNLLINNSKNNNEKILNEVWIYIINLNYECPNKVCLLLFHWLTPSIV